jgi:hypothetical protein
MNENLKNYLRFVEYDNQTLQNLLCFIKESTEPLSFYQDGKLSEIQVSHIEKKLSQCFTDFWILGKTTKDSVYAVPQFTYYKIEAFQKVDQILEWIAENFQWAIFPWGSDDFHSLGVLSSEVNDNQQLHKLTSGLSDKLIAKYEIEKTSKAKFHSLVFDEKKEDVGKAIYDTFDLKVSLPIIATADIISLGTESPDLFNIPVESYEELGKLQYENNIKYSLYKVRNFDAYKKACSLFYGYTGLETDTMPFTVVFPGNTSIELIDRCLKLLLNDRSLIASGKELVEIIEWLFVIDVGDSQLWVISKNPDKIRAIESIGRNIELFCCV